MNCIEKMDRRYVSIFLEYSKKHHNITHTASTVLAPVLAVLVSRKSLVINDERIDRSISSPCATAVLTRSAGESVYFYLALVRYRGKRFFTSEKLPKTQTNQ